MPKERSLATPAVVWDLLLDIDALGHEVGKAYEEGHGYAFDRRDRPTDENDAHVMTSSVSNETGEIALTHTHLRGELRRAVGRLEGVKRDLTRGRDKLLEAFTPTEDDDYQPLQSYKTFAPADQGKSPELLDGEAAREKRELIDEIDRLENRRRRLERRLKQLA